MYDFLLPDVGEGIAEAELLEWLVAIGDTVSEGDPVAVVNTDKVTVELPSPVDGRIAELPWAVGSVISVGTVLIRFGDEGIEPAGAEPMEDKGAEATPPEPTPADAPPQAVQHNSSPRDSSGNSASLGRIMAAPSTRALAARLGIDLTTINGSGPGGRILRADLEPTQVPEAAGSPAGAEGPIRRLSGLRLLSARNLSTSRAKSVTCTTTFEVRADRLAALLETMRSGGARITVPVLIAKCAAHALAQHPHLNGWIREDGDSMQLQQDIDIAFAVATDDGLAVPIVRNVGGRTLRAVAADFDDISQRAREHRLHPSDQRNGTFTVSSTGSLERARILSTTPVINYPQITTLWVGRMANSVHVGDDGSLEVGLSMVASLSFDHRFVDGSDATALINDLADALEQPTLAIS